MKRIIALVTAAILLSGLWVSALADFTLPSFEDIFKPADAGLALEEAPAPGTWICPECGTANTGNFCAECGAARPAAGGWTCPNCGTANTGNFCAECGTPRPAADAASAGDAAPAEEAPADDDLIGIHWDAGNESFHLTANGQEIRFTNADDIVNQLSTALGEEFNDYETNWYWSPSRDRKPIYFDILNERERLASIVPMRPYSESMNLQFSIEYDFQDLPDKLAEDLWTLVSTYEAEIGLPSDVVALYDGDKENGARWKHEAPTDEYCRALIPGVRDQMSWISFGPSSENEVTIYITSFRLEVSVNIPMETAK